MTFLDFHLHIWELRLERGETHEKWAHLHSMVWSKTTISKNSSFCLVCYEVFLINSAHMFTHATQKHMLMPDDDDDDDIFRFCFWMRITVKVINGHFLPQMKWFNFLSGVPCSVNVERQNKNENWYNLPLNSISIRVSTEIVNLLAANVAFCHKNT